MAEELEGRASSTSGPLAVKSRPTVTPPLIAHNALVLLEKSRFQRGHGWTRFHTYIQLSEAEAAFRITKSELSIRPIRHQREERVLAHILVCFLAYILWKTLEQWQSRAGLGNSPRTILEELPTIHSTDVVLPTATVPPHELRLRCVVRPDRTQAALLDRLGLRLPERLKLRFA